MTHFQFVIMKLEMGCNSLLSESRGLGSPAQRGGESQGLLHTPDASTARGKCKKGCNAVLGIMLLPFPLPGPDRGRRQCFPGWWVATHHIRNHWYTRFAMTESAQMRAPMTYVDSCCLERKQKENMSVGDSPPSH